MTFRLLNKIKINILKHYLNGNIFIRKVLPLKSRQIVREFTVCIRLIKIETFKQFLTT